MIQPGEEQAITFKDFKEVLEASPSKAAAFLEPVHAADVATWLQDVTAEDAWQVFTALSIETQAEVIEYAEERLRGELIPRLSMDDLRDVVEELPADEAVDVLAEADERVAEDVLDSIPTELATELRELIAFPPESAGGVMTTEFVPVRAGTRIGDAIKLLKQEGDRIERDIGVYVIDDAERPIGYIPVTELLTNSIHTTVEEAMGEPFTILAAEDQEEAANRLKKYGLQALAVVDTEGALVGVISAEDAQEVFESEVSEDILRLVGTAPERQQTRLGVLTRVRQRMPLMAVTVLGGLVSAKILEVFLHSDAETAAGEGMSILRYLPLIIGLAGNVGIQSSTILVRAFATGEVEPEREFKVLTAEVTVGALIGLICGAATVFLASWMELGVWLAAFGVAVGVAVATAVTWAAFLGCVIPMGCRRLGIDPAITAGPFLISLSDISGAAIYVMVARRLIGL
ncbi:MAG: magnesium transporter [Planctomycetota bacterium]|nr:MAG: magnesium transporter [Planctomycetota bacterium]